MYTFSAILTSGLLEGSSLLASASVTSVLGCDTLHGALAKPPTAHSCENERESHASQCFCENNSDFVNLERSEGWTPGSLVQAPVHSLKITASENSPAQNPTFTEQRVAVPSGLRVATSIYTQFLHFTYFSFKFVNHVQIPQNKN